MCCCSCLGNCKALCCQCRARDIATVRLEDHTQPLLEYDVCGWSSAMLSNRCALRKHDTVADAIWACRPRRDNSWVIVFFDHAELCLAEAWTQVGGGRALSWCPIRHAELLFCLNEAAPLIIVWLFQKAGQDLVTGLPTYYFWLTERKNNIWNVYLKVRCIFDNFF